MVSSFLLFKKTHLIRNLKHPNTKCWPGFMGQQELSFIEGGNAKGSSHFGKQSGISYKTKHNLIQ